MRLRQRVPAAWREPLADAIAATEFAELDAFITSERAAHDVYPPPESVFFALDACPPAAVRVVILGQDPYHGPGQAHGLAFSVPSGVPIPPSLRNIFKERQTDLGIEAPPHGDLSAWARRGVLLLNTVLTVRARTANSHRAHGWEEFTDAILRVLDAGRPKVFVLWGRPAQKKKRLLSGAHTVLEAPHPSPLSAHRGFFGSSPFSACNDALAAAGQPPIDWSC